MNFGNSNNKSKTGVKPTMKSKISGNQLKGLEKQRTLNTRNTIGTVTGGQKGMNTTTQIKELSTKKIEELS